MFEFIIISDLFGLYSIQRVRLGGDNAQFDREWNGKLWGLDFSSFDSIGMELRVALGSFR